MILDFEDKGAIWDIPYENVGRFQFHLDSKPLGRSAAEDLSRHADRFNRTTIIEIDVAARITTGQSVDQVQEPMRQRGAFGNFDRHGQQRVATL